MEASTCKLERLHDDIWLQVAVYPLLVIGRLVVLNPAGGGMPLCGLQSLLQFKFIGLVLATGSVETRETKP